MQRLVGLCRATQRLELVAQVPHKPSSKIKWQGITGRHGPALQRCVQLSKKVTGCNASGHTAAQHLQCTPWGVPRGWGGERVAPALPQGPPGPPHEGKAAP